jgi:aldehyde dehydrogenase (NAD+)
MSIQEQIDSEGILKKQREFFNRNNTKDVSFRVLQLKKLKAVLIKHEDELAQAILLDFGKSEFDFFTTEMGIIYKDIDDTIKHIHNWSKKKRVRTNLFNFPGSSYILKEPFGSCLVIGPWNYPYQLSFSPSIAAIAAGNTVILKPSELPIRTSNIIKRLVNENFAPEVFHVIEGGIEETSALLELNFDKIFFTGSVSVGRIVYQAAAKNLTPVTLELGGKSPAIVTADCDLKITARRIIWGKFLNAGQTCIAPDYVLVDKTIEDQLLNAFKEELDRCQFSIENGNYVQIINDKNMERLKLLFEPEDVFYGGQIVEEKRIIMPTILTEIDFDHPSMQEEIFGPILPIISYKQLDEAIEKVKSLPKPLALYLFTGNYAIKQKVLTEISFGGGSVNDTIMHITNPALPFGGVGPSGIGAYHGEAGFLAFSHQKSIFEKSNWFEPPLKYSPHTPSRLNWIKRLLKWV